MSVVIENEIEMMIEREKLVADGLYLKFGEINGVLPCVFVQKVSPHKFNVGTCFCPNDKIIGDVMEDCHVSYCRKQQIVYISGKV